MQLSEATAAASAAATNCVNTGNNCSNSGNDWSGSAKSAAVIKREWKTRERDETQRSASNLIYNEGAAGNVENWRQISLIGFPFILSHTSQEDGKTYGEAKINQTTR